MVAVVVGGGRDGGGSMADARQEATLPAATSAGNGHEGSSRAPRWRDVLEFESNGRILAVSISMCFPSVVCTRPSHCTSIPPLQGPNTQQNGLYSTWAPRGPCEATLIRENAVKERKRQGDSSCRVTGCKRKAPKAPFLCKYHTSAELYNGNGAHAVAPLSG